MAVKFGLAPIINPQETGSNIASDVSSALSLASQVGTSIAKEQKQQAQEDEKEKYYGFQRALNQQRIQLDTDMEQAAGDVNKEKSALDNFHTVSRTMIESSGLSDEYLVKLENKERDLVKYDQSYINAKFRRRSQSAIDEQVTDSIVALSPQDYKTDLPELKTRLETEGGLSPADASQRVVEKLVNVKLNSIDPNSTSLEQLDILRKETLSTIREFDDKAIGKPYYSRAVNSLNQRFNQLASLELTGLNATASSESVTKADFMKQAARLRDFGIINKDVYNAKVDAYGSKQKRAIVNSFTEIKNSESAKNYEIPLASYKKLAEDAIKAGGKEISITDSVNKYERNFTFNANYEGNIHVDSLSGDFKNIAKKKAEGIIFGQVVQGDYLGAMDTIRTSGVTGTVPGILKQVLGERDPNKIGQNLNMIATMENHDARVFQNILKGDDYKRYKYFKHIAQTKGTITENDINIVDGHLSQSPKVSLKEFNKTFEGNTRLLDLQDKFKFFVGSGMYTEEEAIDELEKYSEVYTKGGVDFGSKSVKMNLNDEQIEEYFEPILDGFKDLFPNSKIEMRLDESTGTLGIYHNAVKLEDTRLDPLLIQSSIIAFEEFNERPNEALQSTVNQLLGRGEEEIPFIDPESPLGGLIERFRKSYAITHKGE